LPIASRLRFIRRAFSSIVDQGTLSAINFLTSLLAARLLDQAHFGAYGFGLSLVFFAQTIQHAILGESQEVLVSTLKDEAWKRMVGTMIRVQLILILALATIVGSAAWLWPDDVTSTVLLGAALVSAALLPHDFIRRLLLARLQVSKTLTLSVGRFAVHFGLLAAVYVWGELGENSLLTFYIVIATGALATVLVGSTMTLSGMRGYFRLFRPEVSTLWNFSRWIIVKNMGRYVLLNGAYWALVAMLGFEKAALYSAGYLIIAVVYVAAMGLSGFFTPYFARLFVERRARYGPRIRWAMLGWVGLFSSFGLAIALWPEPLLRLFYGGKYQDAAEVARTWGFISILGTLTIFMDIIFKSVRRPQEAWRAQIIAMIPPLFLLVPAIQEYQVVGALYCVLGQRLLLNIVLAFHAFRRLSQPDEAPAGDVS